MAAAIPSTKPARRGGRRALTGGRRAGKLRAVMELPAAPGAFGATDPLFLLLAALAIEAYVGDLAARLPRLRHPRALVARAAGELERRLNRPQRSRRALVVRGAIVVVAVAAAAAAAGVALAVFTRNFPFAWLIELFLLVSLLGARLTGRTAACVAKALDADDLPAARHDLRALAGERMDPQRLDGLDGRGVALAAVGGVAARFAAAVVAPAFWYVLLGLPGIFTQQAVRVAATVVATGNRPGGGGFDPEREGDFAFPAVRLDAALVWIPDKLAGLFLALAALFVPAARPRMAARRLVRGRVWALAALGGALGLMARGDAAPSAAAGAGAAEVRRALALFIVAGLIQAALIAALVLLRRGL